MKNKERSWYFQAIADTFFARRGAPFFLSAKDLDLISSWESLGMPLSVVREGIEKAFENLRDRHRGKTKVLSLSFCQRSVLKAFDQYRERKVGHKKRIRTRDEKRKKIKSEIQRFLVHLPPQLSYLREVYLEAKKKVGENPVDEDALEEMDEKVDGLLLASCPDKKKDLMRQELMAENRSLPVEELERIFEIKMVKILRDKFKVPYLSFYYY